MRRAAAVLRHLQLQRGRAQAQASHACGSRLRAFASGLKDVEPKTLAKARRLALAVGTAAGAFGSLVGVGGGVLIVPAIVNACPSIPQRVIAGTSLAAVVATGSTAGAVYLNSGLVDATSALLIAGSAVLTAPLGARYTARLNCQALRRVLGWWLIGVAPLVPAKALLLADDQDSSSGGVAGSAAPPPGAAPAAAPAPTAAAGPSAGGEGGEAGWQSTGLLRPLRPADGAIAATGCLAGFASGLLGIGGGTVVTPMLAVATSLPQTAVLGTSLAAMIPPSFVGLLQHARMGNVDVRMGAALAAGTAIGSYAGSAAALAAPPGVLEAVFAVGMAFLGRKTLQAANKAAAAAAKAATAAK